MISHKYKVIFFHVPKTGGTSIEKLFGIAPFNPLKPDYDNLVGWCPKTKLYLQHATPDELLKNRLVSEDVFHSYTKIVVIRNTYSRLISDYHWHSNLIAKKSNFTNYLLSLPPFRTRNLKSIGTPNDYYSHIRSQLDFILLNGEIIVNKIYYFDDFESILDEISSDYKINFSGVIHEKKGNYSRNKNEYYNVLNKLIVDIKYKDEIKYFNFKL